MNKGDPKPFVIDPDTKKEIVEEGWDENAQIVFKKREDEGKIDPTQYERPEKFANVGSYIRFNKKIEMSQEEIVSMKKRIGPTMIPGDIRVLDGLISGRFKGHYWMKNTDASGSMLINFIDTKGNVAEVDFKYDAIDTLKDLPPLIYSEKIEAINTELKALGFTILDYNSAASGIVRRFINERCRDLQRQADESKANEFDF